MARTAGIQPAAARPAFKLPPDAPAMSPTSAGPPAHPRSPARASRANMAVPPRGQLTDASENAPGHRIPTEKPAQPAAGQSQNRAGGSGRQPIAENAQNGAACHKGGETDALAVSGIHCPGYAHEN